MTRTYGGLTAEQRRTRRRAQLIETAIELLGTKGYADTTVTAVCAESGVTERYFYENFSGRDALLAAVFEHLLAIAQEAVLAAVAVAPPDPEAKARSAIGAFVHLIVDDPRLARIGFVESVAHPAMRASRQEAMRSFSGLIGKQARTFFGPAADGADLRLAELATTMLVGGLFEALLSWLEGHLDMTAEQLVDHCAGLFTAVGLHVLTKASLAPG